MRHYLPWLFVGLLAFGPGWLTAAPASPILSWPGSARPLEREVAFGTEDYPQLRDLVRSVRRKTRWGGLSGLTLSTWVKVPLRDKTFYPIARLSTLPGNGVHRHFAWTLEIAPLPSGGHGVVLRKVHDSLTNNAFIAPFPKEAANRWIHVALSIPELRGTNNQPGCTSTLIMDGQRTVGTFWNDATSTTLGALILGGPGVAIGPTQVFDRALGDGLSADALAIRRPVPATRPSSPPAPAIRCTFDDGAAGRSGWHYFAQLEREGGQDGLPTPNGKGTSSHWYTRTTPILRGDAHTVVFVAKAAPTPGSTLLSLRLHSNKGDEVLLRRDARGVRLEANGAAIACPLPDAEKAFHCYAIRCDQTELSLWVDGNLAGRAALSPEEERFEPLAPYMCLPKACSLFALQLGKRFGELALPGEEAFVADDLSIYGRALTPEEIAAVARTFRLSGATPRPQPAEKPQAAKRLADASPKAIAAFSAEAPAPNTPIPSKSAQDGAGRLLDELLAGESPTGADYLALLPEAEGDVARYVILLRAERCFRKEGAFPEALQVLDIRARTFANSVSDATVADLVKDALRATAVRKPGQALAFAREALAFAQAHNRPKVAEQVADLTAQVSKWLARSRDYKDWLKTLKEVRSGLAARDALDDLRAKAEDGDPAALLALGQALAKADDWGEETLAAFMVCEDATIASLASDEVMADPPDPATALTLADRWWDLAELQEDPALSAAYRRHAAALYRQGKPAAEGLRVRLIEKRITEGGAQ